MFDFSELPTKRPSTIPSFSAAVIAEERDRLRRQQLQLAFWTAFSNLQKQV